MTTETPTPPAPEGGAPPAPALTPPSDTSLIGGAPSGADSTAGADSTSGSESTAGTEGDKAGDSVAGAPDAYEFKFPDGFEANKEQLGKFEEIARAANLPQERAQELLDLYVGELKSAGDAFASKQMEGWKSTLTSWKNEITSDPNFSGEKLTEAQVVIGKALDQFGSKEARDGFQLTGAGDNPAVFRFVHAMAKALTEGGAQPLGAPPSKKSGSVADVFYGPSSS